MNFKSYIALQWAKWVKKNKIYNAEKAINAQQKIFSQLLKKGKYTSFGKEHFFHKITNYDQYKKQVPIREYEAYKTYIERIKKGEKNVLWKGIPIYLAKSSGTTSGIKYIPITRDSIANHLDTARNALLMYMANKGSAEMVRGKMLFLSGSPVLEQVGGISTGRLSGIVNHHIPKYLQRNKKPSYVTNCIENWEGKLSKIVDETIDEKMTLISGIPPWMQMYFDKVIQQSGKKINNLFADLQLIVHGGVNFEPYKKKFFESIGKPIDTIETFPASEGFLAFQDTLEEIGLLLNVDSGIFFEFVPAEEIFLEHPTRLSLEQVELNKNYVLIINSNAGLWGYSIGDTVKFVALNPFRILVTGRTKHFISAFGEHVIGEEVDFAISEATKKMNITVNEFTVAPLVSQEQGKSYHEWFVEFDNQDPINIYHFEKEINDILCNKNIYYDDLITNKILLPIKIHIIKKGGFVEYMKSVGKLGGQNKLPRLSNNRTIADALYQLNVVVE
ncbi:MAG: GH3 family domain-containing protein [Chitinophagaceae bacterium]